jgi:hypothetical protein
MVISHCNPDAEAALEAEVMRLFEALGYDVVNAEHETYGPDGTLGRANRGEVSVDDVPLPDEIET